jgi:hypothetical protein
MPIENAVWKVGAKPARLVESALPEEKLLERMIVAEPSILSESWLLIGEQVKTTYGGFIDLLAIDENQSLIIIELKKHRTPREVVAQAIDYAAWVRDLEAHEISRIYQNFAGEAAPSLTEVFQKRFGNALDEEELNQNHQMVVVAAELDASTERIVNYLNSIDVPINVLFFKVYQDGSQQYLVRTWLLDPVETENKATGTDRNQRAPWNGQYYVSYGVSDDGYNWDDAKKFGFICAGGGRWYSQTMNQLNVGDRVWVNVPGRGYVGVGKVTGTATRADAFKVSKDGKEVRFIDLPEGKNYAANAENEELANYFVQVEWLATRPLNQAISQVGFFGNQNSVCKPRTSKWPFTVETLAKAFGVKL